MKAFGIEFTVVDEKLGGKVAVPGSGYYAKILFEGKPSALILRVASPQDKKTRLVFAPNPFEARETSAAQSSHSRIFSCEKPFLQEAPINWIARSREERPFTRIEPQDNFRVVTLQQDNDILLLNQTEFGVATRGISIFATAQDQWTGYVVGREGQLDFIPNQPHHNYPGIPGYAQLWEGIIPKLQEHIQDLGITVPREAPAAPEWNPGVAPGVADGYSEVVVCLYFSPVAGVGRGLTAAGVETFLADGTVPEAEMRFIHFAAGENQPTLMIPPMKWLQAIKGTPRRGGMFPPLAKFRLA